MPVLIPWLILAALIATGCATARVSEPPSTARMTAPRPPASRPPAPRPDAPAQTGEASWYGPQHHGKRTASGEVYDMNKLTAAHRTLPLGTRVRVTNIENGRSVDVRINDRGPFVDGRVIDLSRAAAERLGALGEGVVRVSLKVISDSASD
jgi:rare lipoprotein A